MPIHKMQVMLKLNEEMMFYFRKRQTWFMPQILQFLLDGTVPRVPSNDYPYTGIQQAFLSRSPKPKGNFYLSVNMNLQSLALGKLSIDLFSGAHPSIADLQTRFDQALRRMAPNLRLPGLMHWSVQQVHYAVDIKTPNIAEFGKLFKRALVPAGFYGEDISTDNFFVGSDSLNVGMRIYDPARHHKDEQPFPQKSKLIGKDQGRLRIDVRCSVDKLYNIRRCYSSTTHNLRPLVFLDQNTANAVLQEYYRLVIGYADFHSLPQAVKMIQAGPGRTDRKEKLSNFIRLLKQSASVGKGLQDFLAGTKLKQTGDIVYGSQRTLDNYMLRYLPELNINPLLLPNNWNLVTLENPMPVADRIS